VPAVAPIRSAAAPPSTASLAARCFHLRVPPHSFLGESSSLSSLAASLRVKSSLLRTRDPGRYPFCEGRRCASPPLGWRRGEFVRTRNDRSGAGKAVALGDRLGDQALFGLTALASIRRRSGHRADRLRNRQRRRARQYRKYGLGSPSGTRPGNTTRSSAPGTLIFGPWSTAVGALLIAAPPASRSAST